MSIGNPIAVTKVEVGMMKIEKDKDNFKVWFAAWKMFAIIDSANSF